MAFGRSRHRSPPTRIQANLLTFGRRLRDAGLPVGSGQILSLVDALATIDVFRHDDVYHAARASVVTRPEQIPVFDLEFSRFWRELLGAKPAPLDPFVPAEHPGRAAAAGRQQEEDGAAAHVRGRRGRARTSSTSARARTDSSRR